MKQADIYVIGCGGIGGYLIERLPMVLASLSLDLLDAAGGHSLVQEHLAKFGTEPIQCYARSLTLIDGDTFEPRNALRQGMAAGSKLELRKRRLQQDMDDIIESARKVQPMLESLEAFSNLGDRVEALKPDIDRLLQRQHLTRADIERLKSSVIMSSALSNVTLKGYNAYVNPGNIREMIPNNGETAVVFLCVDNLKTRYEVSKYMEDFRDCLVINGGNDRTTGHVTLYQRVRGEPLDPTIYEVYPDVRPDVDTRPDERHCTEVAPKHDQIAVTNSIVADVMLARFISAARNRLTETKVVKDKYVTCRFNEVMVDIEKPSMTALYHPTTQRKDP